MRALMMLACALAVGASVYGDFAATMDEVDSLDDQERHSEAFQLLEAALKTESANRNRAEIYWRMARASMYLGDEAERGGAKESQLLPYYEKGEGYGQMAIEADPESFRGYFWKSGNAGRWGQIRGVLNALAKAKEMQKLLAKAVELNPEDKGSFYVLGQLYNEVPGFPLGFGNIEYAAALGRKKMDLMEKEVRAGVESVPDFDYYTELAKHLWRRNWSLERRNRAAAESRAKHAAARDELGRGFAYEGVVSLPAMSDRDEARALAKKAIEGLESLGTRKRSEEDDLKEARETLAGFK